MTRVRLQAGVVLLCLPVLGVATTACGSNSGPPLYLMHQHEARVDEQWLVLGGGCVELDRCSGSAFGGAGSRTSPP